MSSYLDAMKKGTTHSSEDPGRCRGKDVLIGRYKAPGYRTQRREEAMRDRSQITHASWTTVRVGFCFEP